MRAATSVGSPSNYRLGWTTRIQSIHSAELVALPVIQLHVSQHRNHFVIPSIVVICFELGDFIKNTAAPDRLHLRRHVEVANDSSPHHDHSSPILGDTVLASIEHSRIRKLITFLSQARYGKS